MTYLYYLVYGSNGLKPCRVYHELHAIHWKDPKAANKSPRHQSAYHCRNTLVTSTVSVSTVTQPYRPPIISPPHPPSLSSATSAKFSFSLYAVSESGSLAVSGLPRCLCSAISVIVCQIGALGEHNRLPTLVHLCRPWHLYRLSWPPVSVPAPLCFTLHSAVVVFYTFLVQPDYCFAAPPALASPSVICVCLASGHQLELDFNTATDRHTLLQLPAGLENRRWEIRCNVCRSSAHYIPALFAFFPSLVSHIITFASFKHAFHLPKEGNRNCNLKFNITDQFTHIRLHVYPKSKTRYPSTLLKRFQIRSLYTYNNLKHIHTPL